MSIRFVILILLPVLFALLSALTAVLPAGAQIRASAGAESGSIYGRRKAAVVEIDSVERREDLTRVYCRMIGMPHTSDRVDAVQLVVGTQMLQACDIDGIDFRRYFQWEDEGVIALEIDFPPLPVSQGAVGLLFDTVHGEIKTSEINL